MTARFSGQDVHNARIKTVQQHENVAQVFHHKQGQVVVQLGPGEEKLSNISGMQRKRLHLPKVNSHSQKRYVDDKQLQQLAYNFDVNDSVEVTSKVAQRQRIKRDCWKNQIDGSQTNDQLVEIPNLQVHVIAIRHNQ